MESKSARRKVIIVGGVIEKETSLLVATADNFRLQFNVDVRANCEAIRISPESKTVDHSQLLLS